MNGKDYLQPELKVKYDTDGQALVQYIKTTPGRILLNQAFE